MKNPLAQELADIAHKIELEAAAPESPRRTSILAWLEDTGAQLLRRVWAP